MSERAIADAIVTSRLQLAFRTRMQVGDSTERQLAGAVQQTLDRPGSMVRAELAYRVAVAFGLSEESSESLAIATEYFHTASLLFDDLPCMDNAKHRRGERCVHDVYGQATAILAALALVNRAYALVWAAGAELPMQRQSKALRYLESHLGVTGVLDGQSRDLHYSTLPSAGRAPQKVAIGKTVSLIRVALVMPALLGGAAEREIRQLDRLALVWGLSYQALDDLKDVMHVAGEGGKTAERDAHLDRPNLANAIGTAATISYIERLNGVGGKVLGRLVRERPALWFLPRVQHKLQAEIASLSGDSVGAAR
jgi:geranylgeranyl diphosphate synthase type II